MTRRSDQVHLSTYVSEDLATAFRTWARTVDGGVAAALRRLVAEAVDAASPEARDLHDARSAGRPGRPGPAQSSVAPCVVQVHLSTYAPRDLATAFRTQAHVLDGGVAAALRRLVIEALAAASSEPQDLHGARPAGRSAAPGRAWRSVTPHAVGQGQQVSVRLKAPERWALAEAARARGTSPAQWLRSLALVHLMRRPQWRPDELEALRALFGELRAIGHQVNGIARAVDAAAQAGGIAPADALMTREAAERVRLEMRRVVAIISGNYDYWGLPDADRPTAAPGALQRARQQEQAARAQRQLRPRRRPARFTDPGP